ncbi:TonB-dependent receptor plug domain-containing protein [Cupriavidus sp.]|uniref:TonB-dependent receptor plug domain-containing protein n=1 Tax=Cupriavidus sp. TaxID=1873897 RepID=UPI0025C0CD27|nr:TonB-dependent receptor plug domain-containing protein [Cupriavidus sp.]
MQQKNISKAIRLLVSGASAGLVMVPLAVHAQAAATATTAATAGGNVLPQVTVTGQGIGNANEAPTGISRLPETVKETPKTINVVPQEVIEQQHATSLEQILKNVPGITISTGEGNGGQNGDQFRIRGLSAKGDIYVDGLRDFGAYKPRCVQYRERGGHQGPVGRELRRRQRGRPDQPDHQEGEPAYQHEHRPGHGVGCHVPHHAGQQLQAQ